MYSHWSVSGVIEDGKLLWQMTRAPAACLELYGVLTESFLFAHDPVDEHAVLASQDSCSAYGGRAVVTEFFMKAPHVEMMPRVIFDVERVGRLHWWCLCGEHHQIRYFANQAANIVERICDDFDRHVGSQPSPAAVYLQENRWS